MNTNELTVHVVDDDDMFRTAVVRLLQRGGYKVIEYSSGDSLLENPNHMEPGCILLDVRMTGLSGLQLQERLNALNFIPADHLFDRAWRYPHDSSCHKGRCS